MMGAIRDLPKLAMLSTTVRRDLQDPIRYFSKIKVVNFYRNISNDMQEGEYPHLFRYSTPVDLYQKLSLLNPQIIQGVEPFGISTIPFILTGWLYSRQAKIPLIVVSLENRPVSQKYGRVAAGLMKPFLTSYFRHADLIIYLNNGTYQNFLAYGAPIEKMVRLMYGTWGVDTGEFSPAGLKMRLDGPAPVVLFIGRIVEEKGIFDLVDAFALIHDQNLDIELVLIGEGRDEMKLKLRIRSLKIEGKVQLIGRVKNAQIARYLRGADLLVSPSITSRRWEEQVGMVNLQAMSCGVPVVSTLSGAIPEYVEHGLTGILVPEKRPELLAEAILNVLNDSEMRNSLARNGRKVAIEKYEAQENVRVIEQKILDLIQVYSMSCDV